MYVPVWKGQHDDIGFRPTSSAMAEVILEPLSKPTIAVSVLRTYAQRVRDRLLGIESDWVCLVGYNNNKNTDSVPSTHDNDPTSPTCRVVPTSLVKGGRKNRRGFALFILDGTIESVRSLSPIVRQNISATMQLTHHAVNVALEQVGPKLWCLLGESGFDVSTDVLRVDCFPKEETASICLGLQKAAAGDSAESVHPFDGVISMSPSASKCTHILNLLHDEDAYWIGLEKPDLVVTKLNNNAASEVIIEPTDPGTGQDLSTPTTPEAPVSRAYYKLDQVWNEVVGPFFQSIPRAERGVAIDLGAAPGGWTQVLLNHFESVIAVDQGMLATRVAALQGVQQVFADLSSESVAEAIKVASPISILVCDASTDSNEILDKIIVLLRRLGRECWQLPCVWVVTLKLPYKTIGSLHRNLGKVTKTIPHHLRTAAELAFDRNVSIKYKIVHLMANSDSERTLIAVFDHKSPVYQ